MPSFGSGFIVIKMTRTPLWNKCLNGAWQVAHLQPAFGFLDILSHESTVESENALKAWQQFGCFVSMLRQIYEAKVLQFQTHTVHDLASQTLVIGFASNPLWHNSCAILKFQLRRSEYLGKQIQRGSFTGVAWILLAIARSIVLAKCCLFAFWNVLVLQNIENDPAAQHQPNQRFRSGT